jgi:hypothetical protein
MTESLEESGVARGPHEGANFDPLLVESLRNVRAEESRRSGQQNRHDGSDHPNVFAHTLEGFEAPIEMFTFMRRHETGP